MGTSFGTYLGMHIVSRYPDLLYAYVGVGQVVNTQEHARYEHGRLLDYARQTNDTVTIEKLEAMSPFPNPKAPGQSFLANIAYLLDSESALGKCYPASLKDLSRSNFVKKLLSPHYTWRDIANCLWGDGHVLGYPEFSFLSLFMKTDLPNEIGYTFDTPIIFLSGKDDWHIAPEFSEQWLNKIDCPHKEHIVFEHSAHVPFITEPGFFHRILIDKVLPLVYR